MPIFFICLAQKHGIKDKKKESELTSNPDYSFRYSTLLKLQEFSSYGYGEVHPNRIPSK